MSPADRRLARQAPPTLLLVALAASACATTGGAVRLDLSPDEPVAAREPHESTLAGHARTDDYFWLRDREAPRTLEYLKAENAYADAVMAPTAELRERLYAELVARVQEDDVSAPTRDGAWGHFVRTLAGESYPVLCRVPWPADGAAPRLTLAAAPGEQVLLDGNALAEGQSFFSLAAAEPSPDGHLLAYATDTTGAERYTIRVKDLRTGALSAESVGEASGNLAWASDSATFFYTTLDDTNRPDKLWRHRVGTDAGADVLVHHETDASYYASVSRTRSGAFVLLTLANAVTTEVRFVDATNPEGALRVVEPRRDGIEYGVEHHGDAFVILTNDGAERFRVMTAPVSSPGRAAWVELVPQRDGVTLDGIAAFRDFLAVSERAGGLPRVRIRSWVSGATPPSPDEVAEATAAGLEPGREHFVAVPEPSYALDLGANDEFAATRLRLHYTSLVTPPSDVEWDVVAHALTVVRELPVPGYDRARYASERLWATAPDGVKVPISLVRRADVPRDGTAPLFLTGYGAYGASFDAEFDPTWLSLIDRGFVVAIAHVRGGGELGRPWKEDGKFGKKKNTFSDFVACAEHLVREGFGTPGRIAIHSVSAGGLLVGTVINERPELWGAVLAEVPFVDLLNTMADETIPLTVIEWDEWGNPNRPADYEWMAAYSPYDNVRAQAYPPMLVRGGLNDTRVGYWEPTKWVARLRATRTNRAPLLLKIEMAGGHGGASGRYEHLRDVAYDWAFVLAALGLVDAPVGASRAPSGDASSPVTPAAAPAPAAPDGASAPATPAP